MPNYYTRKQYLQSRIWLHEDELVWFSGPGREKELAHSKTLLARRQKELEEYNAEKDTETNAGGTGEATENSES